VALIHRMIVYSLPCLIGVKGSMAESYGDRSVAGK
jgi:hypothetical protein